MKYEFKGTPAPWRWELNEKSKDIKICGGKPMYDATVMDFVRYGMGGAAPRFQVEIAPDISILERSEVFGIEVKGREHHAKWFKTIDHPDANLISAAPDLLQAAIDFIEKVDDGRARSTDSYNKFKLAVHKALNIKE